MRILMILMVSVLSACTSLTVSDSGRKGLMQPYELNRDAPIFAELENMRQQLIAGQALSPEYVEELGRRIEQHESYLARADFHWLLGMNHYMQMRADNSDYENLDAATSHLEKAHILYLEMGENWLAAKSTFLLAVTHARASRYREVCSHFDQTLSLLDQGPGQLTDFDYDESAFAKPQDYVKGMFEETCAVLRHDPGRHNFDEYGNLKILKRRS